MITRRSFITLAAGSSAAIILPSALTFPQKKEKPPALPLELVKEFVGAAHGNLEKTKTLLAETPSLLNATYDWGGGDFEMAIGGAGHMGRADIAEFLISQGGRFDMFVAAMLGKTEIVKGYLTAFPNLVTSKGPHGIPLVTHAEKGGDRAQETLEYIKSLIK